VEDLTQLSAPPALIHALAESLRAHGLRMASAESCTGGLIAAACTSVAGSSDWFERGVVSYSNDAKVELLGVAPELIVAHGAVSEPVARAMVEGVMHSHRVDVAVAVTGIAGPTGGSPAKPVGTVWLAFAERLANGSIGTTAEHHHFDGDRASVRAAAVRRALQGLRERICARP
jgi:nicotinamide-nucleotide amidase